MWGNNKKSHLRKKGKRNTHIGSAPKECNLVDSNTKLKTHFFSVKEAKRALAALILTLPDRKSKDEPKRFVIEK